MLDEGHSHQTPHCFSSAPLVPAPTSKLGAGRAEAVAYDTVEAQADPLDPTTKYFLTRLIDDLYTRRRATVQLAWGRSLRFLAAPLATEVYNRESNSVAMLAAGATRDELQVERIALRIQANPQPPHGAAADFDLIRVENASRSPAIAGRSRCNSRFSTLSIRS